MNNTSLSVRDELMLVEKFEQDFGLKLYQYQKCFLKMMILKERFKRKAMIFNGSCLRRYNGYR